jgi:predicted peptidase
MSGDAEHDSSAMKRPRFELGMLGLVSFGLVACGVGENAEPPAVAPGKPTVGRTRIAPLGGQAAAAHAALRDRICAGLERLPWEARTFTKAGDPKASLRYRLFKPPAYSRTNADPLVLFPHGGGAVRDFDDLLQCASPVFAFGPARFASAEEQARHPAFVLVPWSGTRGWDEENARLILGLIGELRREFSIDPRRLYVTGQSMGGYGTWRMIMQHPDVFAAAVPVCGGGDPASASKAKQIPIWAFHGSADTIVPPSGTREMVEALLKAGGQPIYWEYDGGTHAGTAERAYCEPQLTEWLFAQRRK